MSEIMVVRLGFLKKATLWPGGLDFERNFYGKHVNKAHHQI